MALTQEGPEARPSRTSVASALEPDRPVETSLAHGRPLSMGLAVAFTVAPILCLLDFDDLRSAFKGTPLLALPITGLAAVWMALLHAEMASLVPSSGGLWPFVRVAFGRRWARAAGLVEVWFLSSLAAALVALGGLFVVEENSLWSLALLVPGAALLSQFWFKRTLLRMAALCALCAAIDQLLSVIGHQGVRYTSWSALFLGESAHSELLKPLTIMGLFCLSFALAYPWMPLSPEELGQPPRQVTPRLALVSLAGALLALGFAVLAPWAPPSARLAAGSVSHSDPDIVTLPTITLLGAAVLWQAASRRLHGLARAGHAHSRYARTVRGIPRRALAFTILVWPILAATPLVVLGLLVDSDPAVAPPVFILTYSVLSGLGLFSVAMLALSFIRLRIRYGDLPRSFRAPAGPVAAVIVLALALVAAAALIVAVVGARDSHPTAFLGGLLALALLTAAAVWRMRPTDTTSVSSDERFAVALEEQRRKREASPLLAGVLIQKGAPSHGRASPAGSQDSSLRLSRRTSSTVSAAK